MRRILLVSLVLHLAINQTVCAGEFTQKERKLLEEVRPQIVAQCSNTAKGVVQQVVADYGGLAETPSVKAWISAELLNDEFCSCSAERGISKMTPEFLRQSTPAQQRMLGRQSAIECVVPKVKSTFESFCKELMVDISKINSSINDDTASNFCSCVLPEVKALTPDSFETFYSAPFRQADGKLAATTEGKSGSLFSAMRRCGGSKIDFARIIEH